jgi:hypothetical protein
MPGFFIFAVVFTVIMLEGKRRTVLTILEFVLYAGCFLIAYFRPETITPFASESETVQDIIVGCLAASSVLAIAIHETAETFTRLIASLWKVHPFREGNTRTVITFATQFAEAHGFRMDKTLLKDSADYVRDALVKASDGQYAEYEYLIKIFEDAIRRG